jgi:predicted metal-binding membrane protein
MSAAMEHDRMMADMGMTMDMPWSAVDVFFTFAMWAVMMVGMMTASAAPVMLLFAGMHAGRGAQRAPRVAFAFGAGYLLVWTALLLLNAALNIVVLSNCVGGLGASLALGREIPRDCLEHVTPALIPFLHGYGVPARPPVSNTGRGKLRPYC